MVDGVVYLQVRYGCSHLQEVELHPSSPAALLRNLVFLQHIECPRCQRRSRLQAAKRKSAGSGLPPLRGQSRKQDALAELVRAHVLEVLSEQGIGQQQNDDELFARAMQQPIDFWLAHRHLLGIWKGPAMVTALTPLVLPARTG